MDYIEFKQIGKTTPKNKYSQYILLFIRLTFKRNSGFTRRLNVCTCARKLADYESINVSITRYLCDVCSTHSTKYIGKQSSTACVKFVRLTVLDYRVLRILYSNPKHKIVQTAVNYNIWFALICIMYRRSLIFREIWSIDIWLFFSI